RAVRSGEIRVDGVPMRKTSAAVLARLGIAHIPEDRLRSGLAASLSVTDNAVLREYPIPPVARGSLYRPNAATALARTIADAGNVSVPDFSMPARNLSGGNQQ